MLVKRIGWTNFNQICSDCSSGCFLYLACVDMWLWWRLLGSQFSKLSEKYRTMVIVFISIKDKTEYFRLRLVEHSECYGSSIFNLFWIPWVSWRSLQGTEDDLLASFSFATTFKVLGLLLLHSQSNNMFFLLQLHNQYCGMLLVTNGNKYPIKSLVLLSAILQWETSDMIGCEAREDLQL